MTNYKPLHQATTIGQYYIPELPAGATPHTLTGHTRTTAGSALHTMEDSNFATGSQNSFWLIGIQIREGTTGRDITVESNDSADANNGTTKYTLTTLGNSNYYYIPIAPAIEFDKNYINWYLPNITNGPEISWLIGYLLKS